MGGVKGEDAKEYLPAKPENHAAKNLQAEFEVLHLKARKVGMERIVLKIPPPGQYLFGLHTACFDTPSPRKVESGDIGGRMLSEVGGIGWKRTLLLVLQPCMWKTWPEPLGPNLPKRGPSIHAPTSAAPPPGACTTHCKKGGTQDRGQELQAPPPPSPPCTANLEQPTEPGTYLRVLLREEAAAKGLSSIIKHLLQSPPPSLPPPLTLP